MSQKYEPKKGDIVVTLIEETTDDDIVIPVGTIGTVTEDDECPYVEFDNYFDEDGEKVRIAYYDNEIRPLIAPGMIVEIVDGTKYVVISTKESTHLVRNIGFIDVSGYDTNLNCSTESYNIEKVFDVQEYFYLNMLTNGHDFGTPIWERPKRTFALDWSKFLGDKLVVCCDTKEKAKAFLKECSAKGIKWCSSSDLCSDIKYTNYGDETTYNCDGKYMSYCNRSYYKNSYEIIDLVFDDEVKQLTVAEIQELLGYKVKVVE